MPDSTKPKEQPGQRSEIDFEKLESIFARMGVNLHERGISKNRPLLKEVIAAHPTLLEDMQKLQMSENSNYQIKKTRLTQAIKKQEAEGRIASENNDAGFAERFATAYREKFAQDSNAPKDDQDVFAYSLELLKKTLNELKRAHKRREKFYDEIERAAHEITQDKRVADNASQSEGEDADDPETFLDAAEFLGDVPPPNASDWKKIVTAVRNLQINKKTDMDGADIDTAFKKDLADVHDEAQIKAIELIAGYYGTNPEGADIPGDWETARKEVIKFYLSQFATQQGMKVTPVSSEKRPENTQSPEQPVTLNTLDGASQSEDDDEITAYLDAVEFLDEVPPPTQSDWEKIVTAVKNLQENQNAGMDEEAIEAALEMDLDHVDDETQFKLIELVVGYYGGNPESGGIPENWETARTATHKFYLDLVADHFKQRGMNVTSASPEKHPESQHGSEHSDLVSTLTPALKALIPPASELSSFAPGGKPGVKVLGKGPDISGNQVALLQRNNSNNVYVVRNIRFNSPSVFNQLSPGQSIRVEIKAFTPPPQASSALTQNPEAQSGLPTTKADNKKKKKGRK